MTKQNYDLLLIQEVLTSKNVAPAKIQNIKEIYKRSCETYPKDQKDAFKKRLIHSYGEAGKTIFKELKRVL